MKYVIHISVPDQESEIVAGPYFSMDDARAELKAVLEQDIVTEVIDDDTDNRLMPYLEITNESGLPICFAVMELEDDLAAAYSKVAP